tara:strand:+ start:458 stop:682 length:225 start_codon:yes stop_codon:yes gene_type:complete
MTISIEKLPDNIKNNPENLGAVLMADKCLTLSHQVKDLSLLKKWRYAWRLCNVKKYNKPIPYNHPKGAVIWVNL